MPDKAPESNSTRAANFKLQAIKLCQRSIVGKTARSCWIWVWRGISIHVHTHFVVTEREKSLLFRITKPQWHNNFYLYFQYCANMFAIANEMRFFLSDNNDNVNNVASDSLLRCLHCAHCYFLTCWCFVQEQQTVADDWQRHRPIQFQWHVEFPNRSLMIACNECNYDNYSHNYPNHCVTSCCLFDRRKDSARENVEIFCTIFVDRRTT